MKMILTCSMSVLNIVELQNVVTSSSGLNPTTYLSNQLMNIQEMVQYDQKRINVNVISNFNLSPIQFVAPVNFSNSVSASSNSIGTSGGIVSTIGTNSTFLTIGGPINALELTQASVNPFYITAFPLAVI